eukprot:8314953-Alexandrium_andersonii.AAC.1
MWPRGTVTARRCSARPTPPAPPWSWPWRPASPVPRPRVLRTPLARGVGSSSLRRACTPRATTAVSLLPAVETLWASRTP